LHKFVGINKKKPNVLTTHSGLGGNAGT